MSFFGIEGVFFAFFSITTRWSAPNWFRKKHLFITSCIEKQCTRPLKVD